MRTNDRNITRKFAVTALLSGGIVLGLFLSPPQQQDVLTFTFPKAAIAQDKARGGGASGPGDGTGMGYGQTNSGGSGMNRGPGGGLGSFNPAHHLHFGDVPAGVGSGEDDGHVVGEGGDHVPGGGHDETDSSHDHTDSDSHGGKGPKYKGGKSGESDEHGTSHKTGS